MSGLSPVLLAACTRGYEMNNSEQHERNTRALGLLLLAVGAWILVARFIHIDLGFWLWPFLVIVPGGLIMALGFRDTHRSNEGLVTFGTIVAVTGIILFVQNITGPVSYTHLRAHATRHDLVCRLLLEKK